MDNQCWCCKGRTYVFIKVWPKPSRHNPYQQGCSETVHTSCPACLGRGYNIPEDNERVQSVEMYNQIVD